MCKLTLAAIVAVGLCVSGCVWLDMGVDEGDMKNRSGMRTVTVERFQEFPNQGYVEDLNFASEIVVSDRRGDDEETLVAVLKVSAAFEVWKNMSGEEIVTIPEDLKMVVSGTDENHVLAHRTVIDTIATVTQGRQEVIVSMQWRLIDLDSDRSWNVCREYRITPKGIVVMDLGCGPTSGHGIRVLGREGNLVVKGNGVTKAMRGATGGKELPVSNGE